MVNLVACLEVAPFPSFSTRVLFNKGRLFGFLWKGSLEGAPRFPSKPKGTLVPSTHTHTHMGWGRFWGRSTQRLWPNSNQPGATEDPLVPTSLFQTPHLRAHRRSSTTQRGGCWKGCGSGTASLASSHRNADLSP